MLTWVEINREAIEHNLKVFRRLIGKKVQLMPVIKSNAYGHGFFEVAKICEMSPAVNRICVVSLAEALALRQINIRKPIVILSIFELDAVSVAEGIKKNIAFPLYTLKHAAFLNSIGKKLHKRVQVHLKIDIGTTRVGVLISELNLFLNELKKFSYLNIEGLFGHYASSEFNSAYTKKQLVQFNEADKILKNHGLTPTIKHTACSAATMLHPEAYGNAVRVGLGIYGLQPSVHTAKKVRLRPALSWQTTVIQVKTVPRGTRISYGGTFITKRQTRLAILPVGYWDGYVRALSNKSFVILHGKRCPVRGRICMNLTIVDVTEAPKVTVGDKATLIGEQGKTAVTADELAKLSDTINYEVTTRINPLLPRVLV